MPEVPEGSAFTEDELKRYAFSQLDKDSELWRQMSKDLLENPDGEVGKFVQKLVRDEREQAFNIDLDRLMQTGGGDENGGAQEL